MQKKIIVLLFGLIGITTVSSMGSVDALGNGFEDCDTVHQTYPELINLESFLPKEYYVQSIACMSNGINSNEMQSIILMNNEMYIVEIKQIMIAGLEYPIQEYIVRHKMQLSYAETIQDMSATCYQGWVNDKMREIGCITESFTITISSNNNSIPVMEKIIEKIVPSNGGGCLIATATYGSEMAPQVQQLRELRDNQLLNTESGTTFMGAFNDIYYSFSPIIADYERENPLFKEAVKIAITPMISSLSLMENANSESEVISLGLSVIMLNLGMYLGVPAVVIVGIKKRI
jgi:hypothetical protein